MSRLKAIIPCRILYLLLSGFCYEDAGSYYGISPVLLKAIARAESQEKPNAIGINRAPDGTVKSYDIGICQINTVWRKALGPQRWAMTVQSPCYNAYIGAWILAQCRMDHGDNLSEVLSCYNTGRSYSQLMKKRNYRTAWKAYRYIARVRNELQNIQRSGY